MEGPENVTVARETEGAAIILRAAHDGYAERFGIIHERFVSLSDDGNKLDGEDIFLPATGNSLPENALDHFAVRFHHPRFRQPLTDGHGACCCCRTGCVEPHSHEDEVVLEKAPISPAADRAAPRRS